MRSDGRPRSSSSSKALIRPKRPPTFARVNPSSGAVKKRLKERIANSEQNRKMPALRAGLGSHYSLFATRHSLATESSIRHLPALFSNRFPNPRDQHDAQQN